ncbi:MAG: C25 family cysteine peptidase [Promethearchaeota archaeon]
MHSLIHKSRKEQSSILFLFLIVATTSAFYNIFSVYRDIPSNDDPIVDQDFHKLVEIELDFSELKLSTSQTINGDSFINTDNQDISFLTMPGAPRLPFKTLKLLVPQGCELRDVEIESGKTRTREVNYPIEPAREQLPIGFTNKPEKPDLVFNSSIYDSSNDFPGKSHSVMGIHSLRGYDVLILNVYPVQYKPKIGQLTFTEHMNVKVNFLKKELKNTFFRSLKKDEKIVASLVDNPKEISMYSTITGAPRSSSLPEATYDYVIITNEFLKNSNGTYTFQDLVDYKNSMGIRTTIVTVEDIYSNYTGRDDQEKIRNFIKDAYNEWGIEYILLGGDGDGANVGGESEDPIVPMREFSIFYDSELLDTIPSDLYYAALDGNWNSDGDEYWGEPEEADLLAEVYVGRAPVDSEQELSNFVMKTLAHETSANSYLSKALMVGEDLGWNVCGGDHKDEVKDGSIAHGYNTTGFPGEFDVDTLYDRDLILDEWTKHDLIPLINDGVHIINHLGHADNSDVMKMWRFDINNSFTNNNYFFVYSQGCFAGAFDNREILAGNYWEFDCIAEDFVTFPHGAFAFVGNSRNGWGKYNSTDGSSQFFDRQFFDAIFKESIQEIGRANQDSKEDGVGRINDEIFRYCYYEINLLGDPTACIHSQPNEVAPRLSNASLTPKTGFQNTSLYFNITYTDADNNNPRLINVVINGTEYPMEKQDPLDSNYSDGCMYQLNTYMQPAFQNYSYYFECDDGKFPVMTTVFDDLQVHHSNFEAPYLVNGTVFPAFGYSNTTTFEYSVLYFDPDNNAPSEIVVSINSTILVLEKKDSLDNDYMDGCTYVREVVFERGGLYSFEFFCSDGIYGNSTETISGPRVKDTIVPFDGFYIEHVFDNYLSRFEYKYCEGTTDFLVYRAVNNVYEEKWHENAETREMWLDSYWGKTIIGHAPTWIHDNVSIGDNVSVCVEWEADHLFTISDEITCDYPGIGAIEVWVLEDLNTTGGLLWYEKSTGILLNGTFCYEGFRNYYVEFRDTNAPISMLRNDHEPLLSNPEQYPASGNQTTEFRFKVNYTDLDDISPRFINIVIDGLRFPMEQLDPSDANYTDGAMFHYNGYIQPGTHDVFFECNDWYSYNATESFEVIVSEKQNEHEPILMDGMVDPPMGMRETIFTYEVEYRDADNNEPESVSIVINSTSHSMFKLDPLDTNYMDGCVYAFRTGFDDIGIYTYRFTCSDGEFINESETFIGPTFKNKTIPFDGMYLICGFFDWDVYKWYTDIEVSFNYSYLSGNNYRVTWTILGFYTCSWTENALTGEMSNPRGRLNLGIGHTPLWIDPENISIGDTISIALPYGNSIQLKVFGSYGGVWQLHNGYPADVKEYFEANYEIKTGILSSCYLSYGKHNRSRYNLYVIETNAPINILSYNHFMIPGFNIMHLIGMVALTSIIASLVKKKNRKSKLT